MTGDDEGPKDWEVEDEIPPEALRRKWEQEETSGKRTVACPSCKKETPAENLTCLYCGTDSHLLKEEGNQCRPNHRQGKKGQGRGGTGITQKDRPAGWLSWMNRFLRGR